MIKTFPGVSFQTKNVVIPYEPQCLYHYREELRDAGRHFKVDSEAAQHHAILMNYISEQFKDTIEECKNLREHGLICFGILWTLFKPEDLVFATRLGQPRVYRLKSCAYAANGCGGMDLVLNAEYVDFDGNDFGTSRENVRISMFDGAVPITKLNAFPLHLHDQEHEMRQLLTTRGRKFERLAGQNFCEYSGIAFDSSCTTRKSRYKIDGRVMIDCETYHRIQTDDAFAVQPFGKPPGTKQSSAADGSEIHLVPHGERAYVKLDDDQCLHAR